jgi:hypothetical protein
MSGIASRERHHRSWVFVERAPRMIGCSDIASRLSTHDRMRRNARRERLTRRNLAPSRVRFDAPRCRARCALSGSATAHGLALTRGDSNARFAMAQMRCSGVGSTDRIRSRASPLGKDAEKAGASQSHDGSVFTPPAATEYSKLLTAADGHEKRGVTAWTLTKMIRSRR